jgi:hypothetical protein
MLAGIAPERFISQKPVRGSRVDWSNPLTRQLQLACFFNENGGAPQDACGLCAPLVPQTSTDVWAQPGPLVPGNWSGGQASMQSLPIAGPYVLGQTGNWSTTLQVNPGTAGITMMCWGGINASVCGSRMMECGNFGIGLRNNAGNGCNMVAYVIEGVGWHSSTFTITNGLLYHLCATAQSGTNTVLLVNRQTAVNDTGAPTATATVNLCYGEVAAANSFMTTAYIWSRVLTANEIETIFYAPYAFAESNRKRKYFLPGSAGGLPGRRLAIPISIGI